MSTRKWIGLAGLFAVAAAAVALYPMVDQWMGSEGPASQTSVDRPPVDALSEVEARKIRELTTTMMNPAESERAAAELRMHLEQQIAAKSPTAPFSMVFTLECLAPRFGSLDSGARQLVIALVSDIFGWFGENPTSGWFALLSPSKNLLSTALNDSTPEIQVAAIKVVASSWEWSPPEMQDPAQRKALGIWKADLHAQCAELLRSRSEQVRCAAGVAVVSVAIDNAASKGLVLLHDHSPIVRRTVLLALSERTALLSNEELLSFLRDVHPSVRAAAETVLASRGLSREQIALGTRATDPSPLVRAQAPRHIIQSTAVDRAVWLTHLSRDTESAVRIEAARAMAQVTSDECAARLAEMATSDPDPEVRKLAAQLQNSQSSSSINEPTATVASEAATVWQTPRAN